MLLWEKESPKKMLKMHVNLSWDPVRVWFKDLNPGVDLLMAMDWESYIEESPVIAAAAPLDTSPGDISNNIIKNIILSLSFLLIVVIIVTIIMIKNKNRRIV